MNFCKICSYSWMPRKLKISPCCPKCRARYWYSGKQRQRYDVSDLLVGQHKKFSSYIQSIHYSEDDINKNRVMVRCIKNYEKRSGRQFDIIFKGFYLYVKRYL